MSSSAVLLLFSALGFAILFLVRDRASLMMSVIIVQLVLLLFLSMSIGNYAVLQDVVIALIIFSFAILFVVVNGDLPEEKKYKPAFILLVFCATFAFFILIFSAVEDVANTIAAPPQQQVIAEIDSQKKARLRDKLQKSALLKHSSDAMLILVAASVLILISTKKKS